MKTNYTSRGTVKISDLRKHTAEVIGEIEELKGPITENINIFGNPPDHLLIKTPGLNAVDLICKERQ